MDEETDESYDFDFDYLYEIGTNEQVRSLSLYSVRQKVTPQTHGNNSVKS